MVCDKNLKEKIEISVKLLLSFSITAFNKMKLLAKTFRIRVFAQINVLKMYSYLFV